MCQFKALSLFASLALTASLAGGDIHAFYADEYNTGDGVGNRVLEFDIKTMELVNTLSVPGNTGHHVDRSYHSKLYGVPKNSNFINVIKLSKDSTGKTYMNITKQIQLIHKPRSADAYNKKYDLVLLTAKNRPMGTLINASTDEIVATIGEDMDCTLTDGTKLLSHEDANTPEGALKYQCTHNGDFGGNQISGHPYWLTSHYAAVVDRSNRQINLYYVWREDGEIKTRYVNSVKTKTSIHQIVPRDRSSLPKEEQADFYAVEEGHPGDENNYGIPPSLLKLKLTKSGLKLVKRMPLAREEALESALSTYITLRCQEIYSEYPTNSESDNENRYKLYKELFESKGLTDTYEYEPASVDMPIACMNANYSGGHNADFFKDNILFVGTADGFMHVIDVREWRILNNVNTGGASGKRSGTGHTCFAPKKDVAIVTNHQARFQTAINLENYTRIKDITLPFRKEGIFNAYQSHTCYVDKENKYYYNTWTDGGVFYRIDLDKLELDKSTYSDGIPIQGNFIDIDTLASEDDPSEPLDGNSKINLRNDRARVDAGERVVIDVLKNDKGEDLTITDITSPKCGQADIQNNKIIYQAGPKKCKDVFYYEAKNKFGTIKEAKVKVYVKESKIKLRNDRARVDAGERVVIDVLKNDKGEDLTITDITSPNCGQADIENNKIIYQAGNKECKDVFYYEAKNKFGTIKEAKVKVYVKEAPRAD